MRNSGIEKMFYITVTLIMASLASYAADKQPVFYVSFDKSVNADIAKGDKFGFLSLRDLSKNKKDGQKKLLKLAPGLKGNGLVSGVNGQVVYYKAKNNINPDSWTVTFWVKGINGKNYLNSKEPHQQLFEMHGEGEWTRVYKYANSGQLRLLITRKGKNKRNIVQNAFIPNKTNVGNWTFFALTYRKGDGIKIYLNGILAVEDTGMIPVRKPGFIRFGQSFGGSREANRVMDELKIYPQALTGSEILTKYKKAKDTVINQQASVLKTQGSITIDGKLDDPGWQNASVISGLINNNNVALARDRNRIFVTYDNQYLYLALHSELPAEARNMPEVFILHGILKSTKANHDVNVDADDSFGIDIIPGNSKGKLYRLFVNGIGTTYDYSISSKHETSLKWDPAWDVKSQVSIDGWFLESRIPLKDLNVDKISNGEKWKFQFYRIWKQLKHEKDTWTYYNGKKKNQGDGLGTIIFRGLNGVAVNCKTLDYQDDILKLQTRFTNGTGKKEFVAELKNEKQLLGSKNYIINPGDKVDFSIIADLRRERSDFCQFSVKGKDGTVYWRQNIPQPAKSKEIDISLRKYPSVQKILLSWKLRQLKAKLKNISMSIDILSKKSEKKLYSKEIKPLNSPDGSLTIDSKIFPIGSYRIKISLYANGKNIARKRLEYEKKLLPGWLNNKLGISDKVPPPWIPLKVTGDAVSMWNRTYDFQEHLFPSAIINHGKNILAAPINLQCKTSSGSPLLSHKSQAKTKWIEKSDCKVSSIRKQRLGGVKVTSKSHVEFDGMIWFELEIAPEKKNIKIDKLIFSIPLKKKYATLINSCDYSLRSSGKLLKKGYHSKMSVCWLGNEEGGVQVFAESSQNWIVFDKQKEFEIINDSNQVVMKLNLINKPVTISKPLKFSFGLIVTPVKKTVRHRDILCMSGRWFPLRDATGTVGQYYKKAFAAHKNLSIISGWSQGWWQTEKGYKGNADRTGFYPIPKKNLNKNYGQPLTKYGKTIVEAPYARLQQTWAASPEFALMKDEWTSNTNRKNIPNPSRAKALWGAQVCQNSKSFQDFTLYGINQLLNATKVKAFYFDVSKPHDCNNIYHGCGINHGDGLPSGFTKNILGTRQLVRRIYTLLKEKHPDGLILFHMSGYPVMPCWSFTDALVDGENFVGLHDRKNNRGMENFLTLDKFAAEYAAQNNFGPYSIVLPQFSRSGAMRKNDWKELGYQHAEYLLGLIFLHNSQLWFPAYIPVEPTMKLYYTFDKNGLDSTFEYIGYWKQQAIKLPKDIKASFFISPDKKKAFMIVMNFSWKDKVMDFNIDLSKLGMTRVDSVQMLYPEKKVNFASGTILRTTIPGKNFRLYILKNTNK
jgi:glycosyl hydrolase family 123/concanavalin A-like lectin/glucanase superfamily protein